jgi:hypothetical protein
LYTNPNFPDLHNIYIQVSDFIHKQSVHQGNIHERFVHPGKHPRAICSPSRDVPPVRPQILYAMEYIHET